MMICNVSYDYIWLKKKFLQYEENTRDLSADGIIKLLNKKYRYTKTRQSGSHIRLTTYLHGEHHITIPNHTPVKLGTLSSILNDVAAHLQKTKEQIVDELILNKFLQVNSTVWSPIYYSILIPLSQGLTSTYPNFLPISYPS